MRTVTFLVDDYGNLWRCVDTESCSFWYDAPNKKTHALFMSWEVYDDWGALKEKQ